MKLSIITINYNDATGLERTIKSVQNQSASDFEHLIIDGNSSDGSVDLIERTKEHYSYWISEPDHGIYDAMNKGIRHASGEYLLFLNSGDTLLNDKVLEQALPHLENDSAIVYGDLYIVATDGPSFKHSYPASLDFTFFKQTSLGHPSTFIKKELFYKYGSYRTDLKVVSDWAFFIKVICVEQVSYQKIDLTIAHFYEGGISTSATTADVKNNEIKSVLLEHFDLFNSSFDQLLQHHSNQSFILDQLHPQIGLLTTNKKLLRLLNRFISILSTLLNKKRSYK